MTCNDIKSALNGIWKCLLQLARNKTYSISASKTSSHNGWKSQPLWDSLLQSLLTKSSSTLHLPQCKWSVTVICAWLLNKATWLHSWVITHLSSMINLSPWPSTHSPLVSMEVELILSRWGTPDWNQCPDHCFGNWQPPANREHCLNVPHS